MVRNGVVEGGAEIGFSSYCTKNNFGPTARDIRTRGDSFQNRKNGKDFTIVFVKNTFFTGACRVFVHLVGQKPNTMKKVLQRLAAAAAALLLLAACEDLFRPDTPAGPPTSAYDISEARERPGETSVWVQGYIVGVATGSKKIAFGGPYTKNTNLILGLRDTTAVKEECLSVQLPSGSLRDALNLVDHPELAGQQLYIKGDLVDAYFGIPGLKSPSEYWIASGPGPE
jgi:hypothetical protein